MARLRGPRLRSLLQDLGAIARGEHTVATWSAYRRGSWNDRRGQLLMVNDG